MHFRQAKAPAAPQLPGVSRVSPLSLSFCAAGVRTLRRLIDEDNPHGLGWVASNLCKVQFSTEKNSEVSNPAIDTRPTRQLTLARTPTHSFAYSPPPCPVSPRGLAHRPIRPHYHACTADAKPKHAPVKVSRVEQPSPPSVSHPPIPLSFPLLP